MTSFSSSTNRFHCNVIRVLTNSFEPRYGLFVLFIFGILFIFNQYAYSYSVIKNIPFEGYSTGIEFNSEDGNIYIADYTQNFLTILDPKTEKILDEIEVGDAPVDLAIDTIQDRVYVTNSGSNDLSVVDMISRDVIETIPIGTDVRGIAVDSSNNRAYVTSWLGEISIIDGITLKVIETITVPDGPLYQLAFNPSNNKLYAANHGGESVTIINTNTNEIITEASVKGQPFGISIDKNNDMVYVSIGSDNSLSIIDGNEDREIKNVKMYGIGSTYEIDTDPIKNKIFVANYGAEGVSVLDSLSYEILEFIPVDGHPLGLAFDSHNDKVFTGIPGSNILSIIANVTSTSKPIADAGPDQSVNSNDFVQLDGRNSSDPNGYQLSYRWNQTTGPEVTLSDSTSSNPTFTAPEVNDQTDLIFQLTVTNDEGTSSEPDELTISVNPIATPPPTEEPPRTIGDLIRGIIQNPLDITNSVESANEIRDILTDNDRDNDWIVCDLIGSEDEYTMSNIREILNC